MRLPRQRHIALTLIIVAATALLARPGHSRTVSNDTVVCPFSGQSFFALREKSGTQICLRLDMKPIGFIGAPPLVPVCPDHRFAVYKTAFSPEEIGRLRPWVESDEFRALAAEESPYFRIARTQEQLGEPHAAILHSYLAASWQVESDPDRYRRYVALTLAEVEAHQREFEAVATSQARALSPDEASLLAAELNRRLGRFAEARRQLTAIQATPDSPLARFVAYEDELINQGDSRPHYLPREDEPRCAELDRMGREVELPLPSGEAPPPIATKTVGPLPPGKLRP